MRGSLRLLPARLRVLLPPPGVDAGVRAPPLSLLHPGVPGGEPVGHCCDRLLDGVAAVGGGAGLRGWPIPKDTEWFGTGGDPALVGGGGGRCRELPADCETVGS
mmetsp:Transcript_115310/g.313033  ORF Transcript_115310/g.313033 Transcript_115310/m.313033 type:complete len:104 (+) Transcript_115310:949-1260(+)